MVHKLRALLCGVPKHVAELTIQLTPPLSSVGSVLLLVRTVFLQVSTVLLLVMPVIASSEIVATILGRGGAHVTPAITSSSTLLEGRTSAIKS